VNLDLPTPNPELAKLLDVAKLPDAPLIALHWYDAAFDSNERFYGRKAPEDYKAGILDVVVGMYLGIVDGCVLMTHSAGHAPQGKPTSYRHVWNIPVQLVVKVEVLAPVSANLAEEGKP
jgi:hypothetical protein